MCYFGSHFVFCWYLKMLNADRVPAVDFFFQIDVFKKLNPLKKKLKWKGKKNRSKGQKSEFDCRAKFEVFWFIFKHHLIVLFHLQEPLQNGGNDMSKMATMAADFFVVVFCRKSPNFCSWIIQFLFTLLQLMVQTLVKELQIVFRPQWYQQQQKRWRAWT